MSMDWELFYQRERCLRNSVWLHLGKVYSDTFGGMTRHKTTVFRNIRDNSSKKPCFPKYDGFYASHETIWLWEAVFSYVTFYKKWDQKGNDSLYTTIRLA